MGLLLTDATGSSGAICILLQSQFSKAGNLGAASWIAASSGAQELSRGLSADACCYHRCVEEKLCILVLNGIFCSKYYPVALSTLDWDRESPLATESIFSRLLPLQTICLLIRSSPALSDSAEQGCGTDCRLWLFLNETSLLLYTAVILFVCVREGAVWELVLFGEF